MSSNHKAQYPDTQHSVNHTDVTKNIFIRILGYNMAYYTKAR